MENLEITINLPNLKLNIPEDSINFHTLERIVCVNSLGVVFFGEKISSGFG